MRKNTGIEWTDVTWNPTAGCDKVSGGCKGCYAIPHAHRLAGNPNPKISDLYKGLTVRQGGITNWTGEVRLAEHRLGEPLHWREPKKIFVNSMSDLFHEGLSDSDIFKVFVVMGASQRHRFQILSKRPARMLKWISHVKGEGFPGWPLPNVWLGVSVEDQKTADERIPLLLQTPAAVRFSSYEPALGPVDFTQWLDGQEEHGVDFTRDAGSRVGCCVGWTPPLDWIICGGESGPGARPFDIDWARNTIAQCKAAGVACFVKQLGADPFDLVPHIDYDFEPQDIRLKDRKGGNWDEWPADLRVREFPEART